MEYFNTFPPHTHTLPISQGHENKDTEDLNNIIT